jgi:hypothetical protein
LKDDDDDDDDDYVFMIFLSLLHGQSGCSQFCTFARSIGHLSNGVIISTISSYPYALLSFNSSVYAAASQSCS